MPGAGWCGPDLGPQTAADQAFIVKKPAGLLDRARASAVDFGYRAGWAAVQRVPERFATAAFNLGADLAWRRQGKGAQRLATNLDRVTGPLPPAERAALGKAAMRSYARYWQEVFRLPVTPLSVIRTAFELQDEQILRDAYAAGNGLIVALPHTGNWDYAGAWAVATGMPFTTVAERLEPASLFDRFVAFRESLGFEVIALSGHQRPPFNVLTERLRSGGLLCLLADRDLTSAGIPVTFFGATATMPAGPAALALKTGAVLLPVTLHYPPDGGFGWQGQVHPAVPHTDIATMTQQIADSFAAGIREHPADWHMLQRLWRDDLKARLPLPPAPDQLEPPAPEPATAEPTTSSPPVVEAS